MWGRHRVRRKYQRGGGCLRDIPAGKFGVLVRKFGKDLPAGEIIARDDSFKGIVRDVIGTGRHRINPFAYDIKLYDDITIKPGHVGVVTRLTGADILSDGVDPVIGMGFLVGEGAKGVTKGILKEGTHRLNPFLYSVTIVNVQSSGRLFTAFASVISGGVLPCITATIMSGARLTSDKVRAT